MAEQNRQWQTRQDGLDKIFQTTGPVPKAGDGEVLVRIKTVSLNYRDTEGEAAHPGTQADVATDFVLAIKSADPLPSVDGHVQPSQERRRRHQ